MEYIVAYMDSVVDAEPVLVGVAQNGPYYSVTTTVKHFKKFDNYAMAQRLVENINNAEVNLRNDTKGVSYSVLTIHKL